MIRKLVIFSSILLLGACSSPPKPPVVDGKDRHPINSAESLEVVALRAKPAETDEKLGAEQSRSIVAPMALQTATLPSRSHTVSAYFAYNSTKFYLNASSARQLIPMLAKARRIEIRGRTDGQHPTSADERVALSRALAAQRFLIGQGVSPAIISVNYVSAGDYVADNFAMSGRALNRRVEIEVFNQ
jgi:outer membrane protein OmpA-like peptidoglycan-associated protein